MVYYLYNYAAVGLLFAPRPRPPFFFVGFTLPFEVFESFEAATSTFSTPVLNAASAEASALGTNGAN